MDLGLPDGGNNIQRNLDAAVREDHFSFELVVQEGILVGPFVLDVVVRMEVVVLLGRNHPNGSRALRDQGLEVAGEGLDTVDVGLDSLILVPGDGSAVVVVVFGMFRNQGSAGFHGKGLVGAVRKGLRIQGVRFLLDVEVHGETELRKTGRHGESKLALRVLGAGHHILHIHGKRECATESQVHGTGKPGRILEDNGLFPYLTLLEGGRVGNGDGYFPPTGIGTAGFVVIGNDDFVIVGDNVLTASGLQDLAGQAVIVVGAEIVSGAALHIHGKGGAGSHQDVGLGYVQTAVVKGDIGERLALGRSLEVIQGDTVHRVEHCVTPLSVDAGNVQRILEIAEDVVVLVAAGAGEHKVRLIIIGIAFVSGLHDNEGIPVGPVRAFVQVVGIGRVQPGHRVGSGGVIGRQVIVGDNGRHVTIVTVRIFQISIRAGLRNSILVVGKTVEVDLVFAVNGNIVGPVVVEGSDGSVDGGVEHLETLDTEVGHATVHIHFHLGEVADHKDVVHLRGFGDGGIVFTAPVGNDTAGGNEVADKGAFIHHVHGTGFQRGDGLAGGDEVDIAVALGDGGEFCVELGQVAGGFVSAGETGVRVGRVALGTGLGLDNLIHNVTFIEDNQVQALDLRHLAKGFGGPTLVFRNRKAEHTVDDDFAFGRLRTLRIAGKVVFLVAGNEKAAGCKKQKDMFERCHDQ